MYACQFKKSDDFGSYDEGWELILQTPVILPVPNEVVEGPGGRRISRQAIYENHYKFDLKGPSKSNLDLLYELSMSQKGLL